MMARAVAWSSRHHLAVLALALVVAALGACAWRGLGRDVIPDLSDPQIVLVAEWMGHPATEVAGAVTRVLMEGLEGIPGATAVRGASMSGMAYVDVVFDSPGQLAPGREAIRARVDGLVPKLPPHVRLQLGPKASSTGWVYQYALVDPTRRQSPLGLRRFQDDVMRPALTSIPGVAEVAAVGGGVEQVVVQVSTDELRKRDLAFTDVLSCVRSALGSDRSITLDGLKALPLAASAGKNGEPPRIGALAEVRIANDMATGFADLAGNFQSVGGIVVAERGADLPALIEQVRSTIERIGKDNPLGIQAVTVHDRMQLVDGVGATLFHALAEEIAVVALVILLFLWDGRSALVPLVTLPVVVLLTFAGMWFAHLPITLMSLGGVGMALGLAVDADVVALEASHRRVETLGHGASGNERRAAITAAAASFTPAIVTSLLIAALTFLPVLAWTGESGRLLRPLALGKTLVIAAAAAVALTLAPALRQCLLGRRVRPEFDSRLTRGLVRIYRPFVHFALRRPTLTLATAALAIASAIPIATRLGGEFLPRIDEGDLLFMPTTLSGVPPEEAMMQLRAQERALSAFPEVATVFGKVGRADTATDPAPYSMAETIVRLRPHSTWPALARARWYSAWAPRGLRRIFDFFWPERTPSTTAELVERLNRAARLPGWSGAWTAPVRARLDMMSTGIRTPVALRLVASSASRLDTLGPAVLSALSRAPGTESAVLESMGGETWPRFQVDPAAPAYHQVDPELAQSTADLLLGGGLVGELSREGRRSRVRILPDTAELMRAPSEQVREITVRGSAEAWEGPIPLALVGHLNYVKSPSMIRAEHGELVAYVHVDVASDADVARYVEKAQREIDRAVAQNELELKPGERLEWAGQYRLMAEGERRMKWIVPLILASMLVLLHLQFRSLVEALIVLVSVPFALVGSFWALFLLDYRLSAPVWVGLLSVLGLAMQTGVVMVVYIDEAFHRRVREGKIKSREDIIAAHAEGTIQRLRPKIMTVTTMAASLLPLLFADGAGAEILRRVAAPMLGGLATSAFLTLEVLPVLYTIWRQRQLLRAELRGIDLEAVVGSVPAWARR